MAKHKQETIDFFDKMQEKMQTEDSKRRRLNSKSTSSQPELMFLQFKSDSGESFLTSKTHSMSQQSVTKKTWKPPTIFKSECGTVDTSKKVNDKRFCNSSSNAFLNDIAKTNETHPVENKTQKTNDCNDENNANDKLLKSVTMDRTTSSKREKAKAIKCKVTDKSNIPDYKLESNKSSIVILKSESEFENGSSCSHSNNSFNPSNSAVEFSNKTQPQCLSNVDFSDHDVEDLPTQKSPDLSKLKSRTTTSDILKCESELENPSICSPNNNNSFILCNSPVGSAKQTLSQSLLNLEILSDHDIENFPTQQNSNLATHLDAPIISDRDIPTQQTPNFSKIPDALTSDVLSDQDIENLDLQQNPKFPTEFDTAIISDCDTPTQQNQSFSNKGSDSSTNDVVSDQDIENLPTQRNPNLPTELDTTIISDCDAPTQQNPTIDIDDCNARKYFGDQHTNISENYNEDIQLINSIDLILSENQECQQSQSELRGIKMYEKDRNGLEVESNCNVNKPLETCIESDETSCKRDVEKEKPKFETENSNYASKPSTHNNSSFENIQSCMETNNYSSSLKCDVFNEIQVNMMPIENCGSNNINPTDIISQAIKEIENNWHRCKSLVDNDGSKRCRSNECNQSAEVDSMITTEKEDLIVGIETKSLKELNEEINNEKSNSLKVQCKKTNLKDLECMKQEENIRFGGKDLAENNTAYDKKKNSTCNYLATAEVKTENMKKTEGDSYSCDEDIHGFDDEGSCLMISNSQLMELEQKYYENPDSLKPQVVPTIQTPPNNCTCRFTSTVEVKKEDVGVQTEYDVELESNPNILSLPPMTSPSIQWTKKIQTEKRLKETITEVGRLNAILMKIRKDIWPQRNML